jgi:hypothetical protein
VIKKNNFKNFVVILFTIISDSSFSQNCGSISSWSFTGSTTGANTTYTVNFNALSISGGGKSVTTLVVSCGATTLNTNTTCYVTNPASGAPISYSYSFTVPTCGSTLALSYNGRTNGACGGSTCFTGSAGTALPVTWLEVDATCSSNNTILSWSTASELNNQGFTIQKQVDDEWLPMDWVEGQGTSNSVNRYEHILPEQSGVFRLMQMDFDGTIEYSKVIRSKCLHIEPEVYPNPATSHINFSLEVSKISLISTLGKTVLAEKNAITNLSIPGDLEAGMYILRYLFDDQEYFKKVSIK